MNFNKNRRIKVILISGLLGILIAPQVAFASWWNPFSWDIFSFFQKTPPQEQEATSSTFMSSRAPNYSQTILDAKPINTSKNDKKEITTPPVAPKVVAPVVSHVIQPEQQATNPPVATIETWLELEAKDFVSADAKGWTTQIITNASGEKRYYRKEGAQWVRVNGEADFNTTLCNGAYYSPCSVGSDLVCPSNGESAYCQTQKKTYVENGEYVSLTDSEHEALLQQKHITLQKLQDQIQTLMNHSQKLIADSDVGCTDMTITFQQGRGAVDAWAHSQQCAAASEYAINGAKLDSIQIQGIQEQVRQIQQNYQ